MVKNILIIILLLKCNCITAQILSVESFIEQVKKNHPVAKQAKLLMQTADASMLSAQGTFDPIIDIDASQKKLDGIQYYSYWNPEIKYNSPLGIGVKAGVENVAGSFINTELTQGQSSYAGVELQLLKGLLIDKNRAALQKAKLMQKQSLQENNAILNDLIFDAYLSYWQWAAQYELYQIYASYVQNAKQRLQLVKIAYVQGDRAQADTVETKTQLQNFELLQTDALLQLQNAGIELSQYLWNENGQAQLLPSNYIPNIGALTQIRESQNSDQIIAEMIKNNPQLQLYDFKLQQLSIEKKLKNQNRLPTLNLQANALSKYYFGAANNNMFALQNNNKFGIQFKMPLLLRESRGDYQQVLLKISDVKWQQQNKVWALQNKIRQYTTASNLLILQLKQVQEMIVNYRFLVTNENLKFEQGETSIFLINTRELKLLESQQKQIELQLKYVKAYFGALWASGTLQ